ncbi:MAG: hypothetical protein ACLRT0_06020 [Coprococcus sp.]
MSTVRRIGPGSAHLNADCPIYDKTWKNVIINAKQGDHITVLDSGTEGVKVRHNSTVGYMHCKYVMPDIKKERGKLKLVRGYNRHNQKRYSISIAETAVIWVIHRKRQLYYQFQNQSRKSKLTQPHLRRGGAKILYHLTKLNKI